MKLKSILICAIAMTLSACASTTTRTVERESAYAIYQVSPGEGVSTANISQAVQAALQRNTSKVQINRNIPPSPLPETAPRFQIANPFSGSAMGALIAHGGMQMATCEGALMTANAQDTSMADLGESTSFTVCLWQYQGGYHVDIYTSFSSASGAFSLQMIGATLARKVVGDTKQFIPRTIDAIITELEKTGAEVTLVESYP